MKATLAVAVFLSVISTACFHQKARPCPVPPPPAPVVTVAPAPTPVKQYPPELQPVVVPAPVVQAPTPDPIDYASLFKANVKDIFFNFDKSNIRPDQQPVLNGDTTFLLKYPNIQFDIVSSCDVVGSDKYNDALGQRRVNTVKEALDEVGAFSTSATTLGKTSSYCAKPNCQQLNRRVHFEYLGVK